MNNQLVLIIEVIVHVLRTSFFPCAGFAASSLALQAGRCNSPATPSVGSLSIGSRKVRFIREKTGPNDFYNGLYTVSAAVVPDAGRHGSAVAAGKEISRHALACGSPGKTAR